MKGASFHYSSVLAIILSEEDGRIGNVGQKALTHRSFFNRFAFKDHLRKGNWMQPCAFALSNGERSWSPIISYIPAHLHFQSQHWMGGKSVAHSSNLGEHREWTKHEPGTRFLICSFQDFECVVDTLILLHSPSLKWSQESANTDRQWLHFGKGFWCYYCK